MLEAIIYIYIYLFIYLFGAGNWRTHTLLPRSSATAGRFSFGVPCIFASCVQLRLCFVALTQNLQESHGSSGETHGFHEFLPKQPFHSSITNQSVQHRYHISNTYIGYIV